MSSLRELIHTYARDLQYELNDLKEILMLLDDKKMAEVIEERHKELWAQYCKHMADRPNE